MDFYGILFDMKNGKKIPYSKNYFDTMFAAKLEELGVKTITGTLPLTFTTSETALRSWTIYGNNTQHNYSAEGALPLTFTTHTAGKADDWSISGNDENGTENLFDIPDNTTTGYNNYYASAVLSADVISTISSYLSQHIDEEFSWYVDIDTTYTGSYYFSIILFYSDGTFQTFQTTRHFTPTKTVTRIEMRAVYNNADGIGHQYTFKNFTIVKGSTAPDHYIPYQQGVGEQRVDGYYVPLTISQAGQTDKTVDIFIGDSPLTEGETVSKTSTGVDIELFEGSNTISTDLYNKPEMSIEGVDYVGVGEPVNDSWQIPLAVTCDRNLFNIYGNMGASGGIHVIDYNAETSSITGEMSANSFFQLGTQNAIVKGDETFAISLDKTTAGTAELRIIKGEGSGAEIIETFDISAIKSYRVVFECEESFGNVYPRLVATEAATQTFEHIMIKKASDKGGFVPYGAHTDYTIPIDAPLIDGQSVTDTLTINTFEGENVIDTTLTDPVSMTIKFKE